MSVDWSVTLMVAASCHSVTSIAPSIAGAWHARTANEEFLRALPRRLSKRSTAVRPSRAAHVQGVVLYAYRVSVPYACLAHSQANVVNGFVCEFGVVVQWAFMEDRFTVGAELEDATPLEPADIVNHGNHVSCLVGVVGHTAVPESHIAYQHATLTRIAANGRHGGAARGFCFGADDRAKRWIQVRAGPEFYTAVFF